MIELADAHGLALAAIGVTRRVEPLIDDVELRGRLRAMRKDAEEACDRCAALASAEMLERATIVEERARDMANAWFRAGTEPLGAWSFLAMSEAAELATWTAVAELAARRQDAAVAELAAWALPLQQEHLEVALSGAVRLAS